MSRSLLLLIFVAQTSLAKSSLIESDIVQHTNSRWLTYGCNSNGGGDRDGNRRLSRRLAHPCNSNAKKLSTNDLYSHNTTRESNTFIHVILGLVAGVSILLGFLFIADRDTFEQVTGKCSCSKLNVDVDGDAGTLEPTPFERDNCHLTKPTRDDLFKNKDTEDEGPNRRFCSTYRCWFGHDDTPLPRSEAEVSNQSRFSTFWKDARLKKKCSQRDKYHVHTEELRCGGGKGAPGEDEIPHVTRSYEAPPLRGDSAISELNRRRSFSPTASAAALVPPSRTVGLDDVAGRQQPRKVAALLAKSGPSAGPTGNVASSLGAEAVGAESTLRSACRQGTEPARFRDEPNRREVEEGRGSTNARGSSRGEKGGARGRSSGKRNAIGSRASCLRSGLGSQTSVSTLRRSLASCSVSELKVVAARLRLEPNREELLARIENAITPQAVSRKGGRGDCGGSKRLPSLKEEEEEN